MVLVVLLLLHKAGFSLDLLDMGRTSAGEQSVNGGDIDIMRGGNIDIMGGPNFDRLYHKLKVLLLLLLLCY